jgi:hypothetical protein
MWIFNYEGLKIKPYQENNAKGSGRLNKSLIKMIDNDIVIDIYNAKELKTLGFNTKTIYGCCNKKFKTSQGYSWEWYKP